MENYRLGVTGSMGCGKSYACSKLVEIGENQGVVFTHLDFDDIRRTKPKPYEVLRERIDHSEGIVLVDWALLVEDNLLNLVNNNVLLVRSDYKTQLGRLVGRDLPELEIKRRIDAQLTNDQKERRILEAQTRDRFGKLLSFDTPQNPSDKQYQILFYQILEEVRKCN